MNFRNNEWHNELFYGWKINVIQTLDKKGNVTKGIRMNENDVINMFNNLFPPYCI